MSAIDVGEEMLLDAEAAVVTPENVAFVEAFVEGFVTKALLAAIAANVPLPFVAALIARLVTDERVHVILKSAELKVVELAREAAAKTETTFDDRAVEILAKAEGV